MPEPQDEIRAIEERYARREQIPEASLYNPLDPYVCCARQERERASIRCLKRAGQVPVQDKRVLEVGCGGGANLIDLIRLGSQPQDLVGNDLLDEALLRVRTLPPAVGLILGDASSLPMEEGSFDIVLQSTVFTSILEQNFQEKLANRMWTLLRPDGEILWLDFIWNNPKNPDVRGVPVKRIRQLFPRGLMLRWSVTLAPPIARRLCKA